jgi:hypothetical protein
MTEPRTPPVDPRLTPAQLVEQWREEARRLDALGERYWEGVGSRHPDEWVIATELRKRADQLAAALAVAPSAPDAALRELVEQLRTVVDGMRFVFESQQKIPELRSDTERGDDAAFRDYLERARTVLATLYAVRPPVAAPSDVSGAAGVSRPSAYDAERASDTSTPPSGTPLIPDAAKPSGQLHSDLNLSVPNKGDSGVLSTAPSVPASPPTREGPDYKALYHELILAVGNKYPGESRHMTALRYIQQREQDVHRSAAAVAAKTAPAVSPAPQEGK